jgi:predicted phage terminase large subunit-like protein
MVSGKLFMEDGKPRIYIMPNPVNRHLDFRDTIQKAKDVSNGLGGNSFTDLWVEDVAYQKSAIQEMDRIGLPASGVKVSRDKRARLETVASFIKNGIVLFPRKGCEDLISQLLGFGVESHDDLVDAFVYCVQGLMNKVSQDPQLFIF